MYASSGAKRQRGVGLPAALFVIVILAMVVLAMAELQVSSGRSLGFQVLSTRALYATESGVQLAAHRIITAGGNCGTVTGSQTFDGVEGLSGCQVTLACSQVAVAGVDYFRLTATGNCGIGVEAASRIVEVQVR